MWTFLLEKTINPYITVTGCVCVCVAKELANRLTVRVLLHSEASHLSSKGSDILKILQNIIK